MLFVKVYPVSRLWIVLAVFLSLALIMAACNTTAQEEETAEAPAEIRAQLLVRAPDGPLPVNQPVDVRSLVEDTRGVSHVELYARQLPGVGQPDVLLRSDAVEFGQTSYTASQIFTPLIPGVYEVYIVGYNLLGDRAQSGSIVFTVQ